MSRLHKSSRQQRSRTAGISKSKSAGAIGHAPAMLTHEDLRKHTVRTYSTLQRIAVQGGGVPLRGQRGVDPAARRAEDVHSVSTERCSRNAASWVPPRPCPKEWFETDVIPGRAPDKVTFEGRRFAGSVTHWPKNSSSWNPRLSDATTYNTAFIDHSAKLEVLKPPLTIYDKERSLDFLLAAVGGDPRRAAADAVLKARYGATEQRKEFRRYSEQEQANAKAYSPQLEERKREIYEIYRRVRSRQTAAAKEQRAARRSALQEAHLVQKQLAKQDEERHYQEQGSRVLLRSSSSIGSAARGVAKKDIEEHKIHEPSGSTIRVSLPWPRSASTSRVSSGLDCRSDAVDDELATTNARRRISQPVERLLQEEQIADDEFPDIDEDMDADTEVDEFEAEFARYYGHKGRPTSAPPVESWSGTSGRPASARSVRPASARPSTARNAEGELIELSRRRPASARAYVTSDEPGTVLLDSAMSSAAALQSSASRRRPHSASRLSSVQEAVASSEVVPPSIVPELRDLITAYKDTDNDLNAGLSSRSTAALSAASTMRSMGGSSGSVSPAGLGGMRGKGPSENSFGHSVRPCSAGGAKRSTGSGPLRSEEDDAFQSAALRHRSESVERRRYASSMEEDHYAARAAAAPETPSVRTRSDPETASVRTVSVKLKQAMDIQCQAIEKPPFAGAFGTAARHLAGKNSMTAGKPWSSVSDLGVTTMPQPKTFPTAHEVRRPASASATISTLENEPQVVRSASYYPRRDPVSPMRHNSTRNSAVSRATRASV